MNKGPQLDIKTIKNRAKEMKKVSNGLLTHSACLEALSRQAGYLSWNHYCAFLKRSEVDSREGK